MAALGVAATAIGMAGAALAEAWVPAARSASGDLFEIDVGSASRSGQVAQSWVRRVLAHPERDAASHKPYLTELDQRFDDCQNRRFRVAQATLRDDKGRVVSTGPVAMAWQDVAPESVAEGVWRVACRIGEPPPEKPLLDNISEGRWVRTGLSADKAYYISILLDRLVKLDADHVLAFNRSDFVGYSVIHGYPIKYMVQALVLDCRQTKMALFATDTYMAADQRAESARAPANSLTFDAIPPGSLMASQVKEVCTSATPLPEDEQAAAKPGQVFTGTAWGVSKGYLVTASHVVKDGARIAVYSDGQPVGSARVVADDPASDVALLKLTPLHPASLAVLPLAGHAADLGKSIFTLGYPEPDILGQQVKMTAGEVSGTRGVGDDVHLLQMSVPIQPGNSGGPVIGWDGAVIGVADASINRFADAPSQNVNYAVKASYVRAMLEDLPDLGNYVLVRPAPTHEAMVTAARKAVFMLVVTQ